MSSMRMSDGVNPEERILLTSQAVEMPMKNERNGGVDDCWVGNLRPRKKMKNSSNCEFWPRFFVHWRKGSENTDIRY